MAERRRGVVLVGVSVRALAESAARAGYRVEAVDAFGDLDLAAIAATTALRGGGGPRYSPAAAARVASRLPAAGVAYTANLENHPAAVATLSRRRTLWGNPPEVLRQVRDPLRLARVLADAGFAVPRVRASAPPGGAGAWLLKPRRSGGGHATRRWRRGMEVGRSRYLQEWIAGEPGSIVFAADGRRALPLGLSRQLVGDAAFGGSGFRYCGSLVGGRLFGGGDAAVHEVAAALAGAVTRAFGLVGVNGLDFIVRDGVPYPIEVNPRFSASMELVERATGLSIFDLHLRGCRGRLPRTAGGIPVAGVHGKAIVYARRAARVGDSRRWLADADVRDVPHPGERFARGRPICTVLARGATPAGCRAALARRAARIYRATERIGSAA